ncbi:hypothetical protein [Rhodococcus daqingensis]|uniref:Holin n=1 Tax=Rhodococcus daqingensis TaxID=2479363 RepID=A0ABW2S463_9NOCA
MITNENARKWIYIAQTVLGTVLLVLVGLQVIDQDTSTAVAQAIGGVVLMLTGELARRNVGPRPATISPDGVQVITDALAEHAQRAIGSGAAAVDEARAELERRLGRG